MEQCNEARCVVTLKTSDLILHGCIFSGSSLPTPIPTSWSLPRTTPSGFRSPTRKSSCSTSRWPWSGEGTSSGTLTSTTPTTTTTTTPATTTTTSTMKSSSNCFAPTSNAKRWGRRFEQIQRFPTFLPFSLESSKLQPISFSLYKTLFTPV